MSETESLLSLPKNNFISSESVAKQIVQSAVNSHWNAWRLIEAQQEHIDGKTPMDQKELEKQGLGWVSNFNYGKARAKIEQGCSRSIAKVTAALTLSYATFRRYKKGDDKILEFLDKQEQRGIVASEIGYALSSTLSKETRLSSWLNKVEYPSYSFGYCPLLYNNHDWIPEPVHPLDIAFRPETEPENIPAYVTFKTVPAQWLYERWIDAKNDDIKSKTDPEGKKTKIASSGWNLISLEKCLLKAFKGKLLDKDGRNGVAESWADVVPYYHKNASWVIQNTEDVNIAKIFYKELDGTLTETYITYSKINTDEKEAYTTYSDDNGVEGLLFQKNRGVFTQPKFISLIRDSGFTSKTGYIQDIRGVAKYAVPDSIRYNRLRNGANNKMQFIGSPFFEQSTSQSKEKFKPTVSQGFVLLGQNHKMIERQPTFDISSHLNMINFEEGQYTRDTQQFGSQVEGRLTSRPNSKEVQQVTQEVEFNNNAKNNIKFKDYAQCWFTVLLRFPSVKVKKSDAGWEGKNRFYETLKKNLAWLKEDLSDSDINKILGAIDSFVLEPIVDSIERIMAGIQMSETAFGRNRLRRMLMVAQGFPIEEVNINIPLIQDKFQNMQDQRIALFENDMFFTTNEILVAGTDDHISHLDTHLPKSQRVIQGVQQGAITPMIAYKYLSNLFPHCTQHYDFVVGDPTMRQKAEEYLPQLQELKKTIDQLGAIAQRQQQEEAKAAAQPQLDPVTASDIHRKDVKAQSDQQRKDYVTAETTKRNNEKTQLSHQEKMVQIELDHQAKLVENATKQ